MTKVKLAAEKAREARRQISNVIHGYDEAISLLLVALATGGHTLLEGPPGVGKTTLAKAFANASGLSFKRIQLTPDLMPTDITGHSFFNQATGRFEVRHGPVFTNILLADEINRAPPRTQSALLEVMEEQQVTIDTETHAVPHPFLVVATKNPIDIEGVYPLPEAQLDRFMLFIQLSYPEKSVEQAMLLDKLKKGATVAATADLVRSLRDALPSVRAHPDIVGYILDIVRATRDKPDLIELGAGPRAAEHLLRAARATALLDGREFVIPDDVKRVTQQVVAHRLILTADAEIAGVTRAEVLARILEETPVPLDPVEAA